MGALLTIRGSIQAATAHITLTGELSAPRVSSLHSRVVNYLNDPRVRQIVVDLSGVSHVDAVGAEQLAACERMAGSYHKEFRVDGARPPAQRIG